jgi:diamine N-acetyltransferase
MMLERRPVQRADVVPLIRLRVRPDQLDLVSPNANTLAQAAYETGSYVWGLWEGPDIVGLMAMIHPGEYPWDHYASPQPDTQDRKAAYLWRLMIGAAFQGNGHGRNALMLAMAQARDWGCQKLTAHVLDVPHSNLSFYEKHGFRPTGIVEDGEIVIACAV